MSPTRRTVCTGLAALLAAALPAVPAGAAGGQVRAGVAEVDGTYHVGSSAGQYATDGGPCTGGNCDPHAHHVKRAASYGVQSRQPVRAIVFKGGDGQLVGLVSVDHYIPQDALLKRIAQLAAERTGGALDASNITMAATHNHSSPSYSSLNWGVWAFQDVFDFRFFAYYADRSAEALARAYRDMHDVRVSAAATHFDAIQKNPMGPGTADDGTPAGYPRGFTDHDLSVVRVEDIDDPRDPEPLATLVNFGQHPEFLEGYNLISSEYVGAMERFVDRTIGGVTIFTQNATGTSEVEEEFTHGLRRRTAFNHTQYAQMEWGARLLASAVIRTVRRQIDRQRPHPDDRRTPYGGTSYHDRFVRWKSRFPVGMRDVWFPGPVSHPYPGVSSCRTDPAFAGDPRIPIVGLPDCEEVPAGASLMPVTEELAPGGPGIDTDTLEALGIPIPENYSVPSTVGLQDTLGVHLQAFRLGEILFTICSCEQWVDQSYNIKTRTDKRPGNEWLGYDPTSPDAHPTNRCVPNGDGTHADDGSGTGTWACSTSPGVALPDRLIQRMRARIGNDATGWEDPECTRLGCGLQAESEPPSLPDIFGNYTHDDTDVRGGRVQEPGFARRRGYRMVVTVSMANDYNGYIATYRDYMSRDHYRKALTGFGPHSSDYFATRLVRMGHALKGDPEAQAAIAREADPARAAPGYAALAAKTAADQAHEEAKVAAVGEAAARGAQAYAATLPDDGAGDREDLVQPHDIERFDAATFGWVGGSNYTDMPRVVVQRRTRGGWREFADQSGEVPIRVEFPEDPAASAAYRAGGTVWKWTATFEAFVSRFPLVDPRGRRYRATPPGVYRFRVRGQRRSGGRTVPYRVVSDPFRVSTWDHLEVRDLRLDRRRRLSFGAGTPGEHTFTEHRIRGTSRPDYGPLEFTIGPVDFPDHASDQEATGFDFLDRTRGYSAVRTQDDPPSYRAEHYCLDCRFRDWLDATDRLTAVVRFETRRGGRRVERVRWDDGFRTRRRLGPRERATVVVRDRWGNSGPTAVAGGGGRTRAAPRHTG